jgi:glycosyltransferase involved in cell wall biosynthesis
MRIAIISDAQAPQVNGVVNTLRETITCLRQKGFEVLLLGPHDCKTVACPTYPEIRLAWRPYTYIAKRLEAFCPDYIHISTEGPMGLAARRYCRHHQLQFTTAYHTRFPEYLHARFKLPQAITYALLRWFHGASKSMLVPTQKVQASLQQQGFTNTALWGRGVDTQHFSPGTRHKNHTAPPVFLYVGRVAVEKNIDAFLALDLPGKKVVVGDGPMRKILEQRYLDVQFLGAKNRQELPAIYRQADVFVFPSKTDTFGLVLIEAMACGVPVAAFPVAGPTDVVADGVSGALDDDLGLACERALLLCRETTRAYALRFSWEAATQQFLQQLRHVHQHAVEVPASVV